MSERFPVRNAKEIARVLRRHGFVMVGQKGSHQKWRHANGRQVIVAMHGNKPIPIGTFKSINRMEKSTDYADYTDSRG